jgi:hypothetical protein
MRLKTLNAFDNFLAAQAQLNHAIATEADRKTMSDRAKVANESISELRHELGEEEITG